MHFCNAALQWTKAKIISYIIIVGKYAATYHYYMAWTNRFTKHLSYEVFWIAINHFMAKRANRIWFEY